VWRRKDICFCGARTLPKTAPMSNPAIPKLIAAPFPCPGEAVHVTRRITDEVCIVPLPWRDTAMIRELFTAFVVLIMTVTATAWLNGGPRLSVQQVEASLAR
jgi:hypothetical protein